MIHFAFVYVASPEGAFVFRSLYEIFIREYFNKMADGLRVVMFGYGYLC